MLENKESPGPICQPVHIYGSYLTTCGPLIILGLLETKSNSVKGTMQGSSYVCSKLILAHKRVRGRQVVTVFVMSHIVSSSGVLAFR